MRRRAPILRHTMASAGKVAAENMLSLAGHPQMALRLGAETAHVEVQRTTLRLHLPELSSQVALVSAPRAAQPFRRSCIPCTWAMAVGCAKRICACRRHGGVSGRT